MEEGHGLNAMPHGTAVSTCHVCGKSWISGCVITMTCGECAEKGHTDGFLDCPACRKEGDKLRHEAVISILKEKQDLKEKLDAALLQNDALLTALENIRDHINLSMLEQFGEERFSADERAMMLNRALKYAHDALKQMGKTEKRKCECGAEITPQGHACGYHRPASGGHQS